MDTLFLIRHGSTALNEARRYCGSTDIALSDTGQAQVDALSKRVESIPLTRVVHSPMLRCIETATPIAQAHNLPMESVAGFSEIHFGDWEGLTFDEAHAQFPDEAKALLTGEPSFSFPNGESAIDLHNRVTQAFESILPLKGNTALVAHGGTLRVLLIELGLLSFENAFEFPIDCASITTLNIQDGVYSLKAPNDTGHLQGVALS